MSTQLRVCDVGRPVNSADGEKELAADVAFLDQLVTRAAKSSENDLGASELVGPRPLRNKSI